MPAAGRASRLTSSVACTRRPSGVPSSRSTGDRVHRPQLTPTASTTHVMTRSRARVSAFPPKRRLSRTRRARADAMPPSTTSSTAGPPTPGPGRRAGSRTTAVTPAYCGSTTRGIVSMVSGATNAQTHTDRSTRRCHRRSSTPSGKDPSISRKPTVARPSAVRPTALRYTNPDLSMRSGWVWSSTSYADPTAEAVAPSVTYTATGEDGRREQPHAEDVQRQDPEDQPAHAAPRLRLRVHEAAHGHDVGDRPGADHPEQDQPEPPDVHTS